MSIQPPNRPRRRIDDGRLYVDIETASNGDVLDIGACFSTTPWEPLQYHTFPDWSSFLTWLDANATTIGHQHRPTKSRPRPELKIIAHHGGGFDWLSLVEHFLSTGEKFDAALSGSKIVRLRARGHSWLDSLQVLSAGLDSLGESILGEGKIQIPEHYKSTMELFKEDNPDLYYKYLRRDVVMLHDICEKFLEIQGLEAFPLTAASLAFADWKNNHLKHDVYQPRGEADEFISRAYAGGRVDIFRVGEFDNVTVYDANSMYPSAMLNEFPIDKPMYVTGESAQNAFDQGMHGFYEVEFVQHDLSVAPLLWERNEIMEYVTHGRGVFAYPELAAFLEVGEVTVHSAYVHHKTARIFDSFVDHYYRMRQLGGAYKTVGKLFLNSLYGKFAQRNSYKSLEVMDDAQLLDLFEKINSNEKVDGMIVEQVEGYKPELDLYSVRKRMERHGSRAIQVAAYVTAYARVNLWRAICAAGHHIIYCDTDSVHIEGGGFDKNLLGDELGQWKIEYNGAGCYVGRKLYTVGDTVKSKGIQAGLLAKSDFPKLLNGERISTTAFRPPSLKQVVSGQKSCQFAPLTRRVRYLSDRVSKWKNLTKTGS